jgi:phospholipid-binding lipoprotein MlaA
MRKYRSLLWVIAAVIGLCGCASQAVQIRSLPAETPAADNAAAIEYTAALAAAVNEEAQEATRTTSQGASAPITVADVPPMQTYDPWERLNRFTYRFNARFDEALFLPVANGYRRLPPPVRAGVHNFFGNLAEVDSVINYILQWHLGYGARSLGRFVINSTLGIGGLFDVAKHLKLASVPTGFTTTLGRWGVPLGPYVVIPLLGPSTLRDGIGWLGDYGAEYGVDVAHLYRGFQSYALGVADAVDQRASLDFRYYATGSPFEYETIRFLYVHKRLIEDQALHAKGPAKKRSPEPAAQ